MEDLASRSLEGKPPHIGGDEDKVPARIRAALEGIQEDKPEELRKAVRELLDKESAHWMEQVRGGGNGLSVAHQRSNFFSILLCELWKRAGGAKAGETLVMGAVGGFGRGEMSPASDLDLVFIRDGSQAEVAEEVVKKVLYVLWDLGCKVGHACRTISESIERSESEPMIKTALLDARYLAGSSLLWEKFQSEYKKRSLEREV